MIFSSFENFGSIQKALEENEALEIVSSGFERIPNVTKTLDTPEQIADIEKLIEKIEEDDDVQQVYHNWQTTEAS